MNNPYEFENFQNKEMFSTQINQNKNNDFGFNFDQEPPPAFSFAQPEQIEPRKSVPQVDNDVIQPKKKKSQVPIEEEKVPDPPPSNAFDDFSNFGGV